MVNIELLPAVNGFRETNGAGVDSTTVNLVGLVQYPRTEEDGSGVTSADQLNVTNVGYLNQQQVNDALFSSLGLKSYNGTINLIANTPVLVSHNLALSAPPVICSVYVGGSEIEVDVDIVSGNALTLTSNISAVATVTIVGN